MGELISFRGITKHDINPDMMLENTKGKLQHVVIMGVDHDGEYHFASSMADGGDILWMMEELKHRLFDVARSD